MDTRTLLGALVFIIAPACLQATTSSVPLNYEYDANGNLISGDGKYYEYNDANRLVKIRHYDKTGPVIAEYVYDHTGQRVKKIEDGVTTYYIGKHFEAQPDGDKLNNTSYYFTNGERVAKKDSTGQLSYYHTNHLGSTSVMTDKEGKLVENTRYYPFGEIREGGKEKYSFTGKEREKISSFYYFETRYYNQESRHFILADIDGLDYNPQSLNRYSYVLNNPINAIDPNGKSPIILFGGAFLVGAGYGVLSTFVGDTINSVTTRELRFSPAQEYVSNMVGGGVGGLVEVGTRSSVAADAAWGAVSNITDQLMDYSSTKIAGWILDRQNKSEARQFLSSPQFDVGSLIFDTSINAALSKIIDIKKLGSKLFPKRGRDAVHFSTKYLNGKNLYYYHFKRSTEIIIEAAIQRAIKN